MGVFKRTTKRNGKKREYWYIDYVINGKHKWESVGRVGVVSKSDAKRLFELRKSEILQGKLMSSKNMVIPSFSEFAIEYLEYAKGNKKSWDRDECALKSLVPFFGNHKLDEINPLQIEKYKLLRKKTVSQRTINIELSLLRRMFNLAISWEKCSSSPMTRVNFYKEEPSKERILTKEEESDLLKSSPDHIKPILLTALNTGMRYGEILNLTWNDIDFESGYIHVRKSKTGTDREIPVNDLLYNELKSIKSVKVIGKSIGTSVISEGKSQQCQTPKYVNPLVSKAVGFTSVGVQVPPRPYSQVFTYRNKPLKDIRTAFKSACKRADIKNLRFHDLRHTSATRMIETGASIVAVSRILGHADLKTTMRYAHPENSLKDAVENLLTFESNRTQNRTQQILKENE